MKTQIRCDPGESSLIRFIMELPGFDALLEIRARQIAEMAAKLQTSAYSFSYNESEYEELIRRARAAIVEYDSCWLWGLVVRRLTARPTFHYQSFYANPLITRGLSSNELYFNWTYSSHYENRFWDIGSVKSLKHQSKGDDTNMANPKEMTLSELVAKVLELQKVLPGDAIIVADNGESACPSAPLHFDAVIEVTATHVEVPEDKQCGPLKEAILMATGTTAHGDIRPAVRLRLK